MIERRQETNNYKFTSMTPEQQNYVHKILLNLKLKPRGVEMNSLEVFFLFFPNPKTVNLVQCHFFLSL
jgi:hypothetical protein